MLQVNGGWVDSLYSGLIGVALTKLDIFSGTIPTVDSNFTFDPTAYASQKLLGYTTGFTLQNSNRTMRFATVPPAANATGTGTATWFALYNSTTAANAILGTITDQGDGTGVLILQSVNCVTGQPVNVIEIGIRLF